ncbi:MAG: hypothetical protein GXO83_09260 [Chlorobi bacterium]|nr:hypothetical protein [Chlorobiota bacterium]
MTPAEKKNKEIIKRLFSPDEKVVIRTITEIREQGTAALIPAILEIYRSTSSPVIRMQIQRLLTDLKNQEAAGPLTEEIFKISNPELKRALMAACWQSGLDFSPFLKKFFKSLLTEDYVIALEAFSVIENNLNPLDKLQLQFYYDYLSEHMDHCSPVTRPLTRQLEQIITDTIRSFDMDDYEM